MAAAMAVVGCVAAATEVGGIDIDAKGTLEEMRTILREEHALGLLFAGDLDPNSPVEVHLQNASPTQVVREICRQVGAVYHGWGGREVQNYHLTKGDISLDPRPRVKVGEYTVFLAEVELSGRRAMRFRLGTEAGEPSEHLGLQMRFDLEADSGQAAARLYGVWPQASVVTDEGERLVNARGVARSHPVHMLDRPGTARQSGLGFPAPSGAPKHIAKLNGLLATYTKVTKATCQFGRGEVGPTKQLGEVGCKLTGWERLLDDVSVSFDIPAGVGSVEECSMEVDAYLLGADGSPVMASGTSYRGGGQSREYTKQWHKLAREAQEVVIEATFGWGPLEFVPFTMEDIPLP